MFGIWLGFRSGFGLGLVGKVWLRVSLGFGEGWGKAQGWFEFGVRVRVG